MNYIKSSQLRVLLGGEAHALAQKFAVEELPPDCRRKTYLNTLAVYAIHTALKWIGIETEPGYGQGESWNLVLRAVFDVADLVLPGVGKLECRPVLLGEKVCSLPPAVIPEDRIGFVVIQMNKVLREATILGFTPTATLQEELAISKLYSWEDLLTHLEHLMHPVATSQVGITNQPFTNLSQWFQNVFEPGWQCLEELLGTGRENLAFNLRNGSQLSSKSVKRAKVIDLGLRLGSQSVTMVVYLMGGTEEVGVLVQMRPFGTDTCLPSNLRLSLLSESKEVLESFESRSRDICMQTSKFWCRAGESFSIQVSLNGLSVTEHFVV